MNAAMKERSKTFFERLREDIMAKIEENIGRAMALTEKHLLQMDWRLIEQVCKLF